MKQIAAVTWQIFTPVLEIPSVQEWVDYADRNFLPITSGAALFASLLLWMNI